MKISIVGCGWFGKEMACELLNSGHEIFGTTRSLNRKIELERSGVKTELLNYPHSPDYKILKNEILILNIPPFENELDWFKSWNIPDSTKIIFISSISVYGDVSGTVDENSPITGPLAEQEKWIESHFQNWVILRFAGLVGKDRHPGKFLSGKKDIKGKLHPVNLVHLDDVVRFIKLIIDKKISNEIYNVVSNEHRFRVDFYTDFAKRMNLPEPEFDQSDLSEGKVISGEKMCAFYQLARSDL